MNPFKLSTFEFKMKIGSEIEAGRITINSKAHPALSQFGQLEGKGKLRTETTTSWKIVKNSVSHSKREATAVVMRYFKQAN